MANSIQVNPSGPIWPLGSIVVAVPSTPVGFMSLVDPNNYQAPGTIPTAAHAQQYTVRAQQILIQALKAGASHGTQDNTGNIYICMYGARVGGSGNRDDLGSVLFTLEPGQTLFLASAPMNRNIYSPYDLYVDADNANDSAQVTLFIG